MAGLQKLCVVLFLTFTISQAFSPPLTKKYSLVKRSVSWYQAKTACEQDNMSLATVMNSNEQGRLQAAIGRDRGIFGLRLDNYWIAATNIGCNEFCWLNNRSNPVTYSNWAWDGIIGNIIGGINSMITNSDECAMIESDQGHWKNRPCSNDYFYICEYYS